jgi:hypothetical protein
MRKALVLAALAAMFVGVPVALAGDYHQGVTLVCADCHVMHYSQSHGYDNQGTDPVGYLGAGGPFEYLLRDEVNNLCLTCHNGSANAPDVLDANTGTHNRMAGALNESGTAPYYHATGHTLGSMDPAPGGTTYTPPTHGLNCVSCHYQHGRTSSNTWRNLNLSSLNYQIGGTPDNSKDVWEISATLGQIPVHYATDNVWFQEPVSTASDYATFCKSCHTNFHGTKGGAEVGGGGALGTEWKRHPNADANIGAVGGGHSSLTTYNSRTNKVKVMSATGDWGVAGVGLGLDGAAPADVTPSCFSCHKSHGNQNSFGLIFMSGTGTVTEQGDNGSTERELCKQCHIQG